MSPQFQIVFNPDGIVQMMLLGDESRTLTFDSVGTPFHSRAMAEPAVKDAVRQWMTDTNADGWIGWEELAATLRGTGIAIEAIAAKYPAE